MGSSGPVATAAAPARAPVARATPAPALAVPGTRPFGSPVRPGARVQTIPGLGGVIGADADQLTRLFGAPRLDIREDDARKLQWSGPACILDVYLYPGARGGRATATYVDARRGDGRDLDRAACVAALRRVPPPAAPVAPPPPPPVKRKRVP